MMLVSKTYWAGIPFWFRKPPERAAVETLALRAHDLRQLRAHYWTSTAHPAPRVGVVVMHPRVDFSHHYAIPRLIGAVGYVNGLDIQLFMPRSRSIITNTGVWNCSARSNAFIAIS